MIKSNKSQIISRIRLKKFNFCFKIILLKKLSYLLKNLPKITLNLFSMSIVRKWSVGFLNNALRCFHQLLINLLIHFKKLPIYPLSMKMDSSVTLSLLLSTSSHLPLGKKEFFLNMSSKY